MLVGAQFGAQVELKIMKEIAIIGGGILGLAIGYELSISHPNFKVPYLKKKIA